MQQPKSNKILYIIITILLIFVFASFFGGKKYAAGSYEDDIEKLNDSLSISQFRQDSLTKVNLELLNRDTEDQVVQYSFYSQFKKEQNKNKYYEKLLNDILVREYDRSYLDSLARSVRFN